MKDNGQFPALIFSAFVVLLVLAVVIIWQFGWTFDITPAPPPGPAKLASDYNYEARLRAKAMNGDLAAATMLGYHYQVGFNVTANGEEGTKWLVWAAGRGDPLARAICTQYGLHSNADSDKALAVYRQLANEGNPFAQYLLADCYDLGMERDSNNNLIDKTPWLQKSADHGLPEAEFMVGDNALPHNSLNGHGVIPGNLTMAREWLGRAAAHDLANAQFSVSFAFDTSYGGAIPDDALSAHYLQLAAQQGHMLAQAYLANRYQQGIGVTHDDAKAFKWYLSAAKQGYQEAQIKVAGMYLRGVGVSPNEDQAAYWLNQASNEGSKGNK